MKTRQPRSGLRRAKRGSIGATYLLKLTADLDVAARADAKHLGISVAEWWRRAALVMLAASSGHRSLISPP